MILKELQVDRTYIKEGLRIMKIERFGIGPIHTNCYLVSNEETKEAVIIDPADCPEYLVSHIRREGMKPQAILLTHGHFDHIMGIDSFLNEWKVPVYVHEDEEDAMNDISLNHTNVIAASGYTFSGSEYLKDGQRLNIAGYTFEVLHTPGHTTGCCCYYVESEQVLFSGDTLFCESVGRTDFANSRPALIGSSIREKLFVLPDETKVYPGHDEETSIGHEKQYNPYV